MTVRRLLALPVPLPLALPLPLLLVFAGCGSAVPASSSPSPSLSSSPSSSASPSTAASASAPATEPASHDLPMSCVTSGDMCTPPDTFVDRLCNGSYLDATLVLMEKSPFSRLYLKGKTESWYASGGLAARETLEFDEEVLVLRFRAPSTTGIQIGGATGSYDVLRWNGNCSTLEADIVSNKKPPRARAAPVLFRKLSDKMQTALLANPGVLAAYRKRGRECKGVTTGDVSLACVHADEALSASVVDAVRAGADLAAPDRLP